MPRQGMIVVRLDHTPRRANYGRGGEWAKRVTGVDRSKRSGYALCGDFLPTGESEVAVGSVIAVLRREGTLEVYCARPSGPVQEGKYEWPARIISALDKIEELLGRGERASPLASFTDQQLLDELRFRGYRV